MYNEAMYVLLMLQLYRGQIRLICGMYMGRAARPRRAARPSAAWISFDGKAPPTPVQPLPVGSRIEAVERAEPVFGA